MATTTLTDSKISLKLLVDFSSGKVVFAEAGKDFVFGLMELPLGIILSLVVKHGKTADSGSLGRIYESIQNLDNCYLQSSSSSSSNQTKDSLLKPKMADSNTRPASLLNQLAYPIQECIPVISSKAFGYCSTVERHGHVKEAVTYMVMDDLTVKPTSAVSSVTLLNNLKLKDISCLEEIMVEVDMDKGLKLFMQAFFGSTSVLTDVFLPTKPI